MSEWLDDQFAAAAEKLPGWAMLLICLALLALMAVVIALAYGYPPSVP